MGAIISIDKRWIKISNGSCAKMFDDAITLAKHHARSPLENEYISRLEYERKGFYAGYCPDFDGLFPSLDEKKFWLRCFYDAGRWLCDGRLENPPNCESSPALWIFHTYWCGDLIRELIRREDRDWIQDDEDSLHRAAGRERSLEEYRIKHEAVIAKRAEQDGAGQPPNRREFE